MINLKQLFVMSTLAFLAATASSASTVVVNGSFEDLGGQSLNSSGWNHFSSIPSWTGQPNVEVQSNATLSGIDAQDGVSYVELETNQQAGISQDIFLEAGAYSLSFFYSPRIDEQQTTTNDMSFSIDGLLSGYVIGAPNPDFQWGEWTEVTSTFLVADGGYYTLSFNAFDSSSYIDCPNCGALIDNVRISVVPLPASALLLLLGLSGLGAIRKRRLIPSIAPS
ncbi:VPLPA-CTERM sorting domain-containing protein [Flavimaricola marinus]|uniref:Uncharacterized protein n=1 Tax=Flavimaricola marinus TaxID=1819565 RepID=A0A238LNQ3_9RHOB|nr:VPLPA-CTERM sorting domain-containing protein [Flavimaricola marinus]SMY10410.1 hypothetical protein LOM8899_04593 [Flavimaricola marinus]